MSNRHFISSTALAIVLAVPGLALAANSSTINSEKLLDAEVHSTSGDRVGEVEGVLMDKAVKTQAVIVDVGGFLGMGERRVALDWDELTVTANGDKVTTRYTKEQLKGMREYNFDVKRRETAYHDPDYRPIKTTADNSTRAVDKDDRGKWVKVTGGGLKGSELIGADIVNGKDDEVGNVKDVIFDTSGKITAVLVDPQGVFAGGAKTVAIEMNKIQILQSGEDLRLMTAMSEDQLKALPEYKR
jgi:uncharacterized protein YrrD